MFTYDDTACGQKCKKNCLRHSTFTEDFIVTALNSEITSHRFFVNILKAGMQP